MSYPRARKRFGQHFLTDAYSIARIVELIAPDVRQHLVEIGPGRCALTDPLVASGAKVSVIEIDRDLAARLGERYADRENFALHIGDALEFDFASLARGCKVRVVGNLPYNISSPLILHLLAQADVIADMTFMLQKEVVDRLAADAGSRDYGRLTVMTQCQCRVESYFEIPPTAFDPPPRVVSKLVRITPQAQRISPKILTQLFECVRIAFSQRRKTLRNTLGKHYDAALLEEVGIDLGLRAQEIGVVQYQSLADALARRAGL